MTSLLYIAGEFRKVNPYMDAPQGIGYAVTISAPHMHAYALELLQDHLVEGKSALDVGSSSGYLTVFMAKCYQITQDQNFRIDLMHLH